jgi:hypothetical protein
MDRKTPRGTFQTIGTYWELVESLGDRSRTERLLRWRVKLQREGGLVISLRTKHDAVEVPTADTTCTDGDLLERVLEEVHAKLASSTRLLRQTWEIQEEVPPLSFGASQRDWMVELTAQILRQELRPIPCCEGDKDARWEVHGESRLDCCRLLGILVGKSILETDRPIFSRRDGTNLARYLYKHVLQWPLQRGDLNEVYKEGATTITFGNNDDGVLRDRLFDSIKPQIAALLDGMFTIVPRSFLFVFRSVDELEGCLVSD